MKSINQLRKEIRDEKLKEMPDLNVLRQLSEELTFACARIAQNNDRQIRDFKIACAIILTVSILIFIGIAIIK